jgi:hypothetical protein
MADTDLIIVGEEDKVSDVQDLIELIEGIDPSLKEKFEDTLVPKGNSVVAKSENFRFIVGNLLRGYLPKEVSDMLRVEKGENIAGNEIRQYYSRYVPHELSRTQIMYNYLQKQGSVNTEQVLESLTKLQLSRVLTREHRFDLTDDSGEIYRKELDLLRKITMDLDAVRRKSGDSVHTLRVEHAGKVQHEGKIQHSDVVHTDMRAASKALMVLQELKGEKRSRCSSCGEYMTGRQGEIKKCKCGTDVGFGVEVVDSGSNKN